jgi:hypothetical protein
MINTALTKAYFNRFCNRTDIYVSQCHYGSNWKYTTVHKPVTDELLHAHFTGQTTLSWICLDSDNLAKWCCWDSDNCDGHILTIQNLLSKWGFHTIREGARPGRDGHLWLLLDSPILASDLIRLNKEVLAHAIIQDDTVEFFPKYANKLSQVRGPLGIHRKPGANNERGWFDGPDREVLTQLEWLTKQPLNQSEKIIRIVKALRQQDKLKQSPFKKHLSLSKPFQKINILSLIQNVRRRGLTYIAQCPICAIEGHDKHEDNLRIKLDGSTFCCVYGGPGKIHKTHQIVQLLTVQKF